MGLRRGLLMNFGPPGLEFKHLAFSHLRTLRNLRLDCIRWEITREGEYLFPDEVE